MVNSRESGLSHGDLTGVGSQPSRRLVGMIAGGDEPAVRFTTNPATFRWRVCSI